jgi:ribosomal protein L31
MAGGAQEINARDGKIFDLLSLRERPPAGRDSNGRVEVCGSSHPVYLGWRMRAPAGQCTREVKITPPHSTVVESVALRRLPANLATPWL